MHRATKLFSCLKAGRGLLALSGLAVAVACSTASEPGAGLGGSTSGTYGGAAGSAASGAPAAAGNGGATPTGGGTPTTAGTSSGSGGFATAGASGAGGGATGTAGAAGAGGNTAAGGSTTAGGQSSGGGGGAAAGTGGAAGGGAGGAATTGGSTTGGAAGGGAGGSPTTATRSNGCQKASTLTFGTVPGESGQTTGFGAGGYVRIGDRGFALRLPDNYDSNKPYWLIFGFHWNGGNSKEVDTGGSNGYAMAHFGLQKLSENGAIFVAPDGLSAGWANSGGRDLAFVDEILKLVEDNYCVDKTRIFANGFSYGGGMSYAIACARAKVFRGVAIYNGAQLSGCEGGTDPIAYWQMAGLTDTTCTIEAGRPMRDRFVKNNGCTAQSPPEPARPPPYLATGGHICTTYSGCSSGNPVRWCAHQSGHGNAIVDGTADLFHSCATPPRTCSDSCKCSWVPNDVWSFFKSL